MNKLLIPLVVVMIGCGDKVDRYDVSVTEVYEMRCYTNEVDNGVEIVCGDDVKFISNGTDGANSDLTYETVCPEVPGEYPEVLLKLNNQYLALLVHGDYKQNRLVILEEEVKYMTTDNRSVQFEIRDSQIVCL